MSNGSVFALSFCIMFFVSSVASTISLAIAGIEAPLSVLFMIAGLTALGGGFLPFIAKYFAK